jgi:hypothetical protein
MSINQLTKGDTDAGTLDERKESMATELKQDQGNRFEHPDENQSSKVPAMAFLLANPGQGLHRQARSRKNSQETSTMLRQGLISPALVVARYYSPAFVDKTKDLIADAASVRVPNTQNLQLEEIVEVDKNFSAYQTSQFRSQSGLLDSLHQVENPNHGIMTLIGALVLISSIFGGSSVGVIANFVPTQNNFVQQAQRNGILVLIFLVPAAIQAAKLRTEVDWGKLFSVKQMGFLLLTLLMQLFWVNGLVSGSQHMI